MLDHGLICQVAGIVIVVGAMVLIFYKKINLDAQANYTTTVEMIVGRLRTNSPALVLFFFGSILLILPVVHPAPVPPLQTHYFTVEQEVDTDSPFTIDAYAVATQTTVGNAHHLRILFPDLPDNSYQPHLVLHSPSMFLEYPIERTTGKETITLGKVSVQSPLQAPAPKVQPEPVGDSSDFKGIAR